MRLTLTRDTIAERLQGFTPEHYLYIYGIMKGIALGVAAFVLIPLFQKPATLGPRLSFWAASVGAVMVSHATVARGILLTSFRYSYLDMVVPLAMGVVECLLFTVLQPSDQLPGLWRYWYFLLALHMFLAVALVRNRLTHTNTEDFEEDLIPLVRRYIGWLKTDVRGAASTSVGFLLVGLTMHLYVLPRWPWAESWQFIAGILALLVMGAVVAKAESERKEVIDFIRKLPELANETKTHGQTLP